MQLLARKYQSQCDIKIPKIFWWGKTQSVGIIAMEFAPGILLSQLNTKNFKNNLETIDNNLSKFNIYHNDLNFSNIISDNSTFWVLDFGEATTSPNRI